MYVERRHSCIVIHDYDWGSCHYIEKVFSIYDKLTHRSVPYGLYYDQENRDLYLPGGLDDFYLYKCFPNSRASIKKEPDEFERISKVQLRIKPRDEVQLKALKFCLGIDEYYRNRERSQISLNLNTGKGKTYVAVTVFAYYAIKTMMIASSIDWLKQWKEKILEYTDVTPDEIYTIAGATSIIKLKNGFADKDKIKFFLCSHDTLRAYADKNGWEAVHELFQFLKIGVKIYDEAHLYFNNILMIDFYTDVWKTYYLTATPIKSDKAENRVYHTAYQTIPKISLFDEDKDPHTEYVAIKFNSHPTWAEINRCKNAYGFDRNKYIDYLVRRPNYYKITEMVITEALQTISVNGKILVYIGTNNAIEMTYRFLKYKFPKLKIGIFSSLVPKEEKKAQLDNTLILTTTKSAGAALDIDGLQITIVLNEPFNSPVLARQTLGRTRAKDTMYIDVVDVGFHTLNRYYSSKLKIFNKYATKCSDILYEDYMIDQYLEDKYTKEQKRIEELMKDKDFKQVVTIEQR